MTTPDVPESAVEAATVALWVTSVVDGSPSVGVSVRAALAAAAPHMHPDCGCAAACVAAPSIRADERARVRAALRENTPDGWYGSLEEAADYLDTLTQPTEGDRNV